MKIAFISTRGIPNDYGGFEQFAEFIGAGLSKRGHEVVVYSPHYHPYQKKEYKGVHIKHIYSPETWMGSSIGSFFYDFSCMKDALEKSNFDVIYVTGYTSIIPAFIWYNIKSCKKTFVVTNMDGLEYKRSKFNPLVQKFLLWEERMTIRHTHYLVADNEGIQNYFMTKYGIPSKVLYYGADIHDDYDESLLKEFGLEAENYYLIVARMEPENNIEMAIQGYLASQEKGKRPLILVGKTNTPFAKELVKKYGEEQGVRFMGGIYDFKKLNSVRKFSYVYFHGHSVGGTNPSLLEAMASDCFILAHDNIFNRAVLSENAFYYDSAEAITKMLNSMPELAAHKQEFTQANLEVIRTQYSWEHLVDQHEEYFRWLMEDNRKHATNAK